jgi:hypothetical protein
MLPDYQGNVLKNVQVTCKQDKFSIFDTYR